MVRLGCAGWSLPRSVQDQFPPGASHLERYAACFNAVEINTSFYRPHKREVYARWAGATGADFRFAVKLPRAVSHEARLVGAQDLLDAFAGQVAGLGPKLGAVLVQLPPSLVFDGGAAEAFLGELRARLSCPLACEARHPSWFGADATALLRERGVMRVVADPPAGQPGPHEPTTETIYARLHGSPRVYYSPYSDDYLAQLAADLDTHARAGRTVWCLFDNTASGAAAANALAVLRRLGQHLL
jgi:uncharacterized protein YecE (DUF72 family)